MARKTMVSFDEWVEEVDNLIGERFESSLDELEEDITDELLNDCFKDGMSPVGFIASEVEPLFDEYDDDED